MLLRLKNMINMTLILLLSLALLWHLVSRSYSKIHISSAVMTTNQVSFILKMLDDVMTHLHEALLLIIIQQSWHQFCANFPHAQIFQISSFFMCGWLAIIRTVNQLLPHNLPYLFHIDLSPACWRPPASGITFAFFTSFFEPFEPFKNMCAWYVINIHFLKHFKCFFLQQDQKFQLYSLLGVHHSFLSVYSWTTCKRGGVKKNNSMAVES